MTLSSPGKIVTFYSYKGGTGRSMALANVAWVLASNGKRVLVIDWDLEAPGLHAYFYPFLVDRELTDSEGVIDFVTDFAIEAMTPSKNDEGSQEDWFRPFANILKYAAALDWTFDNGGILDFIPAGRQGLSYSTRVNSFDWQTFYDNLGGGVFLEAAKEKMREEYDYILIDSRTGVSDTAGICTVQMPDILVVCFTLNNQSVQGAAAVVSDVYQQRRESTLQVFPVPMRIENAEQEKLDQRWEFAKRKFAAFPAHMSTATKEQYWSEVAVPYVPYYAYEEILAPFGERHSRTYSLLTPLEKLSAHITQKKVKRLPIDNSVRDQVLARYEGNVDDTSEVGGIAQASTGATAVVTTYGYESASPKPIDDATLARAHQQLAKMPSDEIPRVAPLPQGSRMPLSHNPLFVGRSNELMSLAINLQRGFTNAITGLGGIGKTQLASEFAHRYGQYFTGGVYWLSFADADAVPFQVAACGGSGSMELRQDFSNLFLEEQVNEVMSAWQSSLPRLLVFDDCEDEQLLNNWRPPTGGCRVLLTSRRELWDPTLGVRPLLLDVLSRQESTALLQEHLLTLTIEEPALDAIAEELGDLPLALQMAGNYLARYRFAVSPERYLSELRRDDLLRHRSLQQQEGISPTGQQQSVARTFALSYAQLNTSDRIDALAVALLTRAAHFAPGEPIPRDLLHSTLQSSEEDPEALLRAEDALGRLAELGMLQEQEMGAVRVHRLVAAFVRDEVADSVAQPAVEKALGDAAMALIQEGKPVQLAPLLPHLRFAANAAKEREDERAAYLCHVLGLSLYQLGSYDEARPYWECAVTISRELLGPEDPATLQRLHNLGTVLRALGAYKEAGAIYEEVLVTRERVLGSRHPDVAASLNNLAVLYSDQGRYDEAAPLLQRALSIREDALGWQDPDVAESLINLAALYRDQGRYDEAMKLLERALAIQEEVLGEEHPATALALRALALMLRDRRKYGQARRLLERALRIQEGTLGVNHPGTATIRQDLVTLNQSARDPF